MSSPRVGSYVLHRVLHEGTAGTYHLATHVDEGQHPGPFVLVRYHDSVVEDDLVVRELRAMIVQRTGVEHPGLARPITHGTTDDGRRLVYVVFPYVPGVSASLLDRRATETSRRVALVVATRIISDAARTLDVVGDAIGYEAIDVDLRSLRVSWAGRVVVTLPIVVPQLASQFDSTPSTAKLRQPSPEAVNGEPLTARSTVFQLGVMLYRLVESRHPFHGSSPMETFMRIVNDRPDPLSHPSPILDAIVMRALARNPARRYERPRDFADAIDAKLGSAPRTVVGAETAALCPNERAAEVDLLDDFGGSETLTAPDPDDDEPTIEELGS